MTKTDDCGTCLLLGCSCIGGLSLVAAAISYYVFSIIFLVNDKSIADDCSISHIWEYVLTTLVINFLVAKSSANGTKKSDEGVGVCAFLISLLITVGIGSWGGVEIYSHLDSENIDNLTTNNTCTELKNSDLVVMGKVMFWLQMSIVGILLTVIVLLVGYSVCTKTPNDKKKPADYNSTNMGSNV